MGEHQVVTSKIWVEYKKISTSQQCVIAALIVKGDCDNVNHLLVKHRWRRAIRKREFYRLQIF